MKRNILVLGCSSPIARATLMALARGGDALFMATSDLEEGRRIASDLAIRTGAQVCVGHFNAEDAPEQHRRLLVEALDALGPLDGVLSFSGTTGTAPNTLDPDEAIRILQVNFVGLVSMMGLCATHLEERGQGFILGVSSVAGDRGRQSNFVYGAAKGGFNRWLEGLRHRLFRKGIRVITIKPGFVDTAMTFGKVPAALAAAPERLGERIAMATHKGSGPIYAPSIWRPVMLLIRHLPDAVFLRTRL